MADYKKLYRELYNDVSDMMGETYNKMKELQLKSNLAHMEMQRDDKPKKAKKPTKKADKAK